MSIMKREELKDFVSMLAEKFDLCVEDEESTLTTFVTSMTLEEFIEEMKQVEILWLHLYHKDSGKAFGTISFTNEYNHHLDCSVTEIYDYSANDEMVNLIDDYFDVNWREIDEDF